jgi:4a-hydroxytetrahydrobiopterin dehydratase
MESQVSLEPSGWEVVDGHHLRRVYRFPDFTQALAFVNRIGALAEEQNHHPDLHLGWGRVEVTTFTHSEGTITAKDHALATAIDHLLTA